MLRVYVDEPFAHFLDGAERGGRVVDECAAFSVGGNLSAYDDGAVVSVDVGIAEHLLHTKAVGQELTFNDALLFPALDEAGRRAVALQEGEGTEDDALTGTGLSSDDAEAVVEIEVEVLDEGVVGDVE